MLSMPRVSVRFQRCFASFRSPPQVSNACITGDVAADRLGEGEVVALAAGVADPGEDLASRVACTGRGRAAAAVATIATPARSPIRRCAARGRASMWLVGGRSSPSTPLSPEPDA